jgi:hypothetical protein
LRDSRPVLREPEGEVPLGYSPEREEVRMIKSAYPNLIGFLEAMSCRHHPRYLRSRATRSRKLRERLTGARPRKDEILYYKN